MKKYLTKLFILVGLASPMAATADATHLNVDHREMVQLRMAFAISSDSCTASQFQNDALKLVLPTGKLANREYSVPAGKELIITDVSWALRRTGGAWNGGNVRPRLIAQVAGDTSNPLFRDGIANLPAVAAPETGADIIFGRFQLTAGARVASRRTICALAPRLSNMGSIISSDVLFRELEIYGYLADKTQ